MAKKLVDQHVGPGMSEKASQVLKNFDLGVLSNQNIIENAKKAVDNADVDGFFGQIKSVMVTVAFAVHEKTDIGDPTEQD